MSDPQLMEEYFFILEHLEDPNEVFKDSPTDKAFASTWLLKLCNDIYRSSKEKQLRNLYLMELSKCIQQGKLKNFFNTLPPKGQLQPLESSIKIKIDPRTIIDEMKARAAELMPHVSPRNYQTHMRTQMFDDNQGACAYVAVSLGDPKDGPIWMEMGSQEPFNQTTNIKQEEQTYDDCDSCDYGEDDDKEVNKKILEFCLQETAKEIAGLAQPGECQLLEEQLVLYEKFIRNYDIGNEARNLYNGELRTFLLVNFQTDLLHALQKYQ